MDAFPTSPEERKALVDRFEALQKAYDDLYERLVEALPDDLLLEAAGYLRLARSGEIAPADDLDVDVLSEYALHMELDRGQTYVANKLAEGFAEAGSQDERLLRAMAEARFSFFEMVEILPGLGYELRDLLRRSRTRVVVTDQPEGLEVGIHMAGRLAEVDGMTIMAGPAFPVPKEIALALLEALRKEGDLGTIAEDAREPLWVGSGILEALMEMKQASVRKEPVRSNKVGRNEPCPCGSGKKHKKCCGALS